MKPLEKKKKKKALNKRVPVVRKGMCWTFKAPDYFDLTSNIRMNWLLSSPATFCVCVDSKDFLASEIKGERDPTSAHWH